MVSTDSLRVLRVLARAFSFSLAGCLAAGRAKDDFSAVREPIEIVGGDNRTRAYTIYLGISPVSYAGGDGLDLNGDIGFPVFRLFDQINIS